MKSFNIKKLSEEQKALRRRILELSHFAHRSHLGSCLSSIDLIDTVYKLKQKDEKFVLSNGHAAVAWYAVLEKYGLIKKEVSPTLHVHPDRNPKLSIDVSTGSLGHGLPIAVGMALAKRNNNVYCMISDGELNEGSIWEALRIASEQKLANLKIIVNANGWGAYDPIPLKNLPNRFKAFGLYVRIVDGRNLTTLKRALKIKVKNKPLLVFARTSVEQFPFLKGQDAHYYVMKDEDYNLAMEQLQ